MHCPAGTITDTDDNIRATINNSCHCHGNAGLISEKFNGFNGYHFLVVVADVSGELNACVYMASASGTCPMNNCLL